MMRPIDLPGDMQTIADLLANGFQYPENPAWSAQSDEIESIQGLVATARRLWPLIWLGRLLSPALRDAFRGYLWEENGTPVGLIVVQRIGISEAWVISAVTVLPPYRRQGIARKLVEAAITYIRERGAETIQLSVIKDNLPARLLYENLGFVTYLNSYRFELTQEMQIECEPVSAPAFTPIGYFDDRPQLALLERITPAPVKVFEPVTKASFFLSVVQFLLGKFGGEKEEIFIIMADGRRVAYAERSARMRPGGVNRLYLRLDPACPELADVLLRTMICTTQRISPGKRLEFSLPEWQEALIQAARGVGCTQRIHYLKMGLKF